MGYKYKKLSILATCLALLCSSLSCQNQDHLVLQSPQTRGGGESLGPPLRCWSARPTLPIDLSLSLTRWEGRGGGDPQRRCSPEPGGRKRTDGRMEKCDSCAKQDSPQQDAEDQISSFHPPSLPPSFRPWLCVVPTIVFSLPRFFLPTITVSSEHFRRPRQTSLLLSPPTPPPPPPSPWSIATLHLL